MRLLILGASDSEGTLLADYSDSWRELLRNELPALIGQPVEVLHRRLYVHTPNAMDYLDRCLTETTPDFVIFGTTAFMMSTPSVGNRLRRRFGTRAGDWFERRFAWFDEFTAANEGSFRERVNLRAHSLAGKTIGRDSAIDYDSLLALYQAAVDRIARDESIDAILMGTTYNGPVIQKRLPHMRAEVDRFNAAIKAMANARRYGWVDRQAVISSLPDVTNRPDQMHNGAEVHRAYADALKPLIVERARLGR
ncbi:MAG: hypothetical protein ABI577_14145 [bacterium]